VPNAGVLPCPCYIAIADIDYTDHFSLSLGPYKLQVASLLQDRPVCHWTEDRFSSPTIESSRGDQVLARC